jgi:superfamily I DNA/RNA helicase
MGAYGRRSKNDVLLETVNRFKGLESQIIFLWGLDGLDLRANEELLYVGLSRAKSLLIIYGTPTAIELLK